MEKQEILKLLAEWCMQYTDKFINEDVAPNIEELINDKAFTTLLAKWKLEKKWYDTIRLQNINYFFDSKVELSALSKNLKLKEYSNMLAHTEDICIFTSMMLYLQLSCLGTRRSNYETPYYKD